MQLGLRFGHHCLEPLACAFVSLLYGHDLALMSASELIEECRIVLAEHSEVFDLIFQIRDTLDSHS